MDDSIELILDIFDEAGQRALARGTLTVGELVDEILQEFEDLDRSDPAKYALAQAGSQTSLAREQTLIEQGVQAGDRLVFGWAQATREAWRAPVTRPGLASLRDVATGVIYPIEWQPARIGRRDANPAHNELLLVDLEWLPNGLLVSRKHAQVTEREGVFFLEALAENNPTRLNGLTLPPGQNARLNYGDHVELGQSGIVLEFIIGQT